MGCGGGKMNQAFLRLWFGLKTVNIYGFGVWDFLSRYFMASWTHLVLGSAQISLFSLVLKLWERGKAIRKIHFENCVHLTPTFPGLSAMGWRGCCAGRGQRKDGALGFPAALDGPGKTPLLFTGRNWYDLDKLADRAKCENALK